jgi:hypothetical protein
VTLIAALRCREGVVLCSDSRLTRGVRGRRLGRATRKIYEPRPGLLMAAAGAQDVSQEFALRLRRAPGLPLKADRLQQKSSLQALLRSLRDDPEIEGRSDHVEFLLAWWSQPERKAVALHLLSGGAAEWVDGWAFGGVQLGIEIASFAVSTMRYLDPAALALEQSQLVALKVLRDTIETGVEGVAGKVQLGTVASDGVRLVSEVQQRKLEDALDAWEAQCAELLVQSNPYLRHTES